MKLSIVTSLKPNEIIDETLKQNLLTFALEGKANYDLEWILVSSDQETLEANSIQEEAVCSYLKVKKIWGGRSRASCMNLGVEHSMGELLWFLHADSSFSIQAVEKILEKTDFDQKIYYFHLKFSQGLWAMKLNEWGVRFRCRFLKTPFGDQGLIMTRETFQNLGGYDESAPYGEDHLLIRLACHQNISIEPIGAYLITSPRKYQENGWFRTTMTHQYLWYKQMIGWYRQVKNRL